MQTHITSKIAATAAGIALLAPVLALAQVGAAVNTTAAANVTTTSAKANVRASVTASSTAETTRASRAKDKGDQEIDRRIAALNELLVRVTAMGKVTDTLKANLKTNIQTEIDGFTTLKAKVDADADITTLKTDIKSITDSYRIFVLVVPQGRITAAADRMATIINMMVSVGTKLQARINTAKGQGSDTVAIEAALADLGTKLQSAQTHAQASVNVVAPLAPDNGDKTVMASNDAALKKAQDEIKLGQADLVAANKDIATIIKGLGSLKASTTATTSVKTQ